MAFYPATLEPLPAVQLPPCGFRACMSLAAFVFVAGGAGQFKCCVECGKLAIEADRRKPGIGWVG